MVNQLTDEQETLLANMIEQARDHARALWKPSANDEAFDRGFGAAIDFALSDEFEHFIYRLKSMLAEGGSSCH